MRLRGPERRVEEFAIPFVCLLLCVTYLPFLYVSMAFLDASTPLDDRILSPYLILSVVAGFPGLGTLARRLGKPLAWWGFAVAMVILILVRAPAAIAVAQEIRRDGIGYTSRHWTDSATVAYAQALPSGARIYSNAPDILRFLDLRPATQLPAMTNALTLQPNPSYSQMLNAMCEDLASGRAYLVLFDSMNAWNLPDRATLEARCQPRLVQRLTDGTVYGGP